MMMFFLWGVDVIIAVTLILLQYQVYVDDDVFFGGTRFYNCKCVDNIVVDCSIRYVVMMMVFLWGVDVIIVVALIILQYQVCVDDDVFLGGTGFYNCKCVDKIVVDCCIRYVLTMMIFLWGVDVIIVVALIILQYQVCVDDDVFFLGGLDFIIVNALI